MRWMVLIQWLAIVLIILWIPWYISFVYATTQKWYLCFLVAQLNYRYCYFFCSSLCTKEIWILIFSWHIFVKLSPWIFQLFEMKNQTGALCKYVNEFSVWMELVFIISLYLIYLVINFFGVFARLILFYSHLHDFMI